MNPEDENEQNEKSLKYSVKETAVSSFSFGLADNYLSAYAIALKSTTAVIGLLTALPNLIGPLAQTLTSRLMKKWSRKRIFLVAVFIQILFWLPIIYTAFLYLNGYKNSPSLLVIFFVVYIFFGNIAGPAWISWMGDLVDEKKRGKFFGQRNSIGSLTAAVGIILGGFILDYFKFHKVLVIFWGFALIFAIAMILRFVSLYFIFKQKEPKFVLSKESDFSFLQFIKKARFNIFGKFSICVALMLFAANIAGPYYAVYMLRELKFSYTEFMLVNLAAVFATFIYMPLWGKAGDKFGNVGILKVNSLLVAVPCFLWFFTIFFSQSISFYFLVGVNFFAGFAWAGYNLSAGNFFYDCVSPQKRSYCSAYHNILNGLGVVVGALLGSFLIEQLPIKSFSVIMFISLMSGLARVIIAIITFYAVKEVKSVEKDLVFDTICEALRGKL